MKLKKGDKVEVYGHYKVWGKTQESLYYGRGHEAKIISITANDEIVVKDSEKWEYELHPMQCRKVKKK